MDSELDIIEYTNRICINMDEILKREIHQLKDIQNQIEMYQWEIMRNVNELRSLRFYVGE